MNFKIGDEVWCIDPTNKNGLYKYTYYHRPCRIVDIVGDYGILVKIIYPENGFERNIFRVDRRVFDYIGGINMNTYYCSVYPREGRELNAIHEVVNNKVVTIEGCSVGERGHIFAVNGGGVHTSTIQQVDNLCEGDIRITTRNSIYELTCMGDKDAS